MDSSRCKRVRVADVCDLPTEGPVIFYDPVEGYLNLRGCSGRTAVIGLDGHGWGAFLFEALKPASPELVTSCE